MILGVILMIVGAVMHPASVPLIVVGALIFVFGLVMLIISFATKGVAD
jgi:hypothetical protein